MQMYERWHYGTSHHICISFPMISAGGQVMHEDAPNISKTQWAATISEHLRFSNNGPKTENTPTINVWLLKYVRGCRDSGNNRTQIHPGWGPWIYLLWDSPAVPMLLQLLDPLWPYSTAARTSYWRKKTFCVNWIQDQLSRALVPQNLLIGLGCLKESLFLIPSQITGVALKHWRTVTRMLRMAQASSDTIWLVK